MAVDTLRCGSCATENPPTARFCSNCGAPLAGKASAETGVITAETRRIITVLFADLVGSTALTERLDPEDARAAVGKFYDTVRQTVERYGGTIANFLGDAVLAVFGLPVTHEDDPVRAVRAGLALRDAMAELNRGLQAQHALTLDVRVGINTGEVVAASGSTFDRDFLISDAVTTAARIQQTMGPGSVVVGERTHRLTRDVIGYRDRALLDVKGKADPLRVWEAQTHLAGRGEASRDASPLVGRQTELSLLRQLYERSRAEGLVHLVTIVGQPGIGKSRLLREFLVELQDTDPAPLVLSGRSVAIGGEIGYPALLDILKAQGTVQDTDPPEVVRAKLDGWLSAVLPGSERLVDGLLLTFGASNGAAADPEQARRDLFDAWRHLLTGLAMTRPVVTAFDDTQWADDGLLDLIQSLLTTVEGTSLFLVCLGRQELLERRPAWGGRNAFTIDLRPLRPREIEQLVEAISGHNGLTPEMRMTVAQRAEGNPLFAEELVRMLSEGSAAPRAPGSGVSVPDTVQAVVTARIDRLPPDERKVLQAAAVLGRRFWPSAAAQLAGISLEEATRTTERLVARELVSMHRQSAIAGEPEYVFRQILTRDVAYGMLPRAQRQRAHARAAEWLEVRLGERVEEIIQILAEHVRLAGDHARAAILLHRAAGKARRLYANAEAIRLFDQALESARKASLTGEVAGLYLGRGEVHQLLGAYADALNDFAAGLAAAREASDRNMEAALENRVGFIHHRLTQFEQAEEHFRRAAELARKTGDTRTLGSSLVDLATLSWDLGDLRSADATLTEGIGHLREAVAETGLARALNLRAMANMAMGLGTDAVSAAEEALALARRCEDKSREATSLSYLSVIHNWFGLSRKGIEYGRQAAALAESIGDRRRVAYAKEFLAQAYHDLGLWGEGTRLTLELLPVSAEMTPLETPFLHFFLGDMYFEIGAFDEARSAFQASTAIRIRNPAWARMALIGELFAARIDRNAAAFDHALTRILAGAVGVFAPVDGYLVLPVSEALAETNRFDDLRAFLAAERPVVERAQSPPYLGALAIADGLLAIGGGHREQGAAHFDEAIRLAERSEHVIVCRRARELRLHHFGRDEDRKALQRLHARLAADLPDDLRAIFLASPRVRAVAGD